MKITASLIVISALASASSAYAEDVADARSQYVLSARGPGDGQVSFGVAGHFLAIIPIGLDLRVVWNAIGRLDLHSRFAISPIVSRGQVGARFHIVEGGAFALSAGVAADSFVVVADDAEATLAVTPSLLASVGGKAFDVTLELSAPIMLKTYGAQGPDPFTFGELTLGFELEALRGMNVTMLASVWFSQLATDRPAVIPWFGIGLAW